MTRVLIVLALASIVSCASAPTSTPPVVRLTPPTNDVLVVGVAAEPWLEICVERPFGDGTPMERYDCVTVGELRAMVLHRRRAND